MNYFEESLNLHRSLKGKIRISPKMDVRSKDDLSLVYSPGVAAPCQAIAANPDDVYKYTIKSNTVAIVTDGSAVLGLGDIGALASIPVMEGKAMLFKRFANIDAFPICLDTQDTDKIVETVRLIAPVFGGVNLEDISAPRSFEIERRLQDIGIPVFHDDQHGTAIVTLAGLLNGSKLVGKKMEDLKIVINGAGAAGIAIARLLKAVDNPDSPLATPVKDIVMCDSKGIIHAGRNDLNYAKLEILEFTNAENQSGTLKDALVGADVFIGVSMPNLLDRHDIRTMAKDSIIFAMANPIPEIMPEEAKAGGAAIVGTGRSDLPNQINNVLGFPGIFRGALDARAPRITPNMKLAAARAIAEHLRNPTVDNVIPPTLDEQVAWRVADEVRRVAQEEFGVRED
ncbi:NADP-dependent malic enzyme [Neolewinella lacunae]|uniref:NADP-dependent malic enzyme n=1 Tax=Neolewinella lacunae TaxID=1517758 RepID=A0A923PME5_9BACT|nr:NADP-dependent malic enzyme [Neolewinella lacunae]MBC6993858.1 NADP-dependent malic enzyme [Neolewinella lacunae]MDN3637081.1 NADP-dependent malic enzyme [Neolewinella lacunae]